MAKKALNTYKCECVDMVGVFVLQHIGMGEMVMASFQQTLWAVQPISSGAIRQKSVGESTHFIWYLLVYLCVYVLYGAYMNILNIK